MLKFSLNISKQVCDLKLGEEEDYKIFHRVHIQARFLKKGIVVCTHALEKLNSFHLALSISIYGTFSLNAEKLNIY